jgi:hypothetical protein
MSLSADQTDDALPVMQQYLDLPPNSDGKTPEQLMAVLDQKRADWIDEELKPLVEEYLSGRKPLESFKWNINAFNKRHGGWGFLGPNGQLFFNMLVNSAPDASECDRIMRDAIKLPTNEHRARSQINSLEQFVDGVRQGHKRVEGTTRRCPNLRSIPFFVSYFWQIQDRSVWPIYYTNAVNSMVDLEIWQPTGDLGADYITFKHLYEELAQLFTARSGKPFDLYGLEHVFWFTGGHPYVG